MLHEAGTITSGEFALLDRYFSRMTQRLKVDLIVYIRSNPSILRKRISLRGRVEEEGLRRLEGFWQNNLATFEETGSINRRDEMTVRRN